MSATVDKRPTSSKPVATQYGRDFVLEREIDFSVTANNLAQNATMALWDIPADTIITDAFIEVTTVSSDVTDIDLGCSTDGSTAADLIDGATLANLGYVTNGTVLPAGYNAAQQVVVTNKDANTMDAAKVRFIIKGFYAGANASAAPVND
jgi:hypothetical protein